MRSVLKIQKIRTSILALIFFVPGSLLAQYAVGIKGGINFCTYAGQYSSDRYSEKIAPAFGLVAQFQKTNWLSFQSELNFETKGAKYNFVKISESYYTEEYKNFEEDLKYITVPVMAKFDLGNSKRVYGYGGLYLGYLLSARIHGTYIKSNDFENNDQEISNVDRNFKSDINNFDLGMVVGVGTDFSLSDDLAIFIDGRLNRGWINVAEQGQGQTFNKIWELNIGLVYRLTADDSSNY